MKQWIKLPQKELLSLLHSATLQHLQSILKYPKEPIDKSRIGTTKLSLVNLFVELIADEKFRLNFYDTICQSKVSKKLYHTLLWREDVISKDDAIALLGRDVTVKRNNSYGFNRDKLEGELALISYENNWGSNRLFIDSRIRTILKLIHPAPDDIILSSAENIKDTKYQYSNEENILDIITTIGEMVSTDLVSIGKSGEKPLAKTLNIIKNTTTNSDFYTTKKIDNLAMDMLVRSFYFYHIGKNKFAKDPLATLKKFFTLQFTDELPYSMSRVFLSHLKKVKFRPYFRDEAEIFNILREIVNQMPKDAWVDVDSTVNYCSYRDIRLDLYSSYETTKYYLDIDSINGKEWDDKLYAEDSRYNDIVLEPMMKALFFYLGALGAVELKYDDPISPSSITAKSKVYISLWDGLKYIKLTPLGLYLFGFEKKYKVKKSIATSSKIKFDEYKPMITIDKNDYIMIAKLEPYADMHDGNRYTLNYKKIFQGCNTKKLLEKKIDKFYTLFSEPIPALYDNYFDDILSRINLLNTDDDKVIIELKNDKRLLNLFVSNCKTCAFSTSHTPNISGPRLLLNLAIIEDKLSIF